MASSKKKKLDPFIKGSYAIPSFVLNKAKYNPVYDIAIVKKGKDKKLHFYRIDGVVDENSELYEISADEAWADYTDQLLSGAISHDIIPAYEKLLEEDGWKNDDGFDSLNLSVRFMLEDYQEEFNDYETPSKAIKSLPNTHDDWLAQLLMKWQSEQPFYNYDLCKVGYQTLYPYLTYESGYAPYIPYKSGKERFGCNPNSYELLQLLVSFFSDVSDDPEDIEMMKNTIHDIVALAPSRKDNENEINALAKYKALNPEIIKEAITEAIANIKAVIGLDRKEAYIAEIEAIFQPFIED